MCNYFWGKKLSFLKQNIIKELEQNPNQDKIWKNRINHVTHKHTLFSQSRLGCEKTRKTWYDLFPMPVAFNLIDYLHILSNNHANYPWGLKQSKYWWENRVAHVSAYRQPVLIFKCRSSIVQLSWTEEPCLQLSHQLTRDHYCYLHTADN